MRVTLEYTAQLRHAAGMRSETVELAADATLRAALRQAGLRHGGEFAQLLLTAAGNVQPTLLLFHCDRQVPADQNPFLSDGDTVTIMSPISGG